MTDDSLQIARVGVLGQNWGEQMCKSGDLGLLKLACKHNNGHLPHYLPYHIRQFEEPEMWEGVPVVEMGLMAPSLYFTKDELGVGHSLGFCSVRGCDFVPFAYKARSLCLHFYIHHYSLLKLRVELVLNVHDEVWPKKTWTEKRLRRDIVKEMTST